MSKYKKPVFIESQLGNNPFVKTLVIPVYTLVFEQQFKKDKDGDFLPVKKKVDYNSIAKLYNSSSNRLHINQLPISSKELLLWIIFELEAGKDYIWINKKRYMEEVKIKSINTYKSAIAGLLHEDFRLLKPTIIEDVYHINPEFFFCGDRVGKYPNNIKEI